MADLIRAQSPATAVFPDLGLSGEEISTKERVTKSRLDVEAAAESSDEQYFKADRSNNVSKSKESEELVFKNGEGYLRAEFTPDGKLKCFFCPQELKQVKRHINGKHKSEIRDQAALEHFCQIVLGKWKREKVRVIMKMLFCILFNDAGELHTTVCSRSRGKAKFCARR